MTKSKDTRPIKYIDAAEFQRIGFLQEVNRCFFHPLGLAMEVLTAEDEDGNTIVTGFGGIWDFRDDPEGMCFAEGVVDVAKAARVEEERQSHAHHRRVMFGGTIQPVKDGDPWYD